MEILLGALAEAIFAVLTEDLIQLPKLATLREKLRGDSPQKLAFQRALAAAYAAFSRKYPGLAASFFDEHFLQKPEVAAELAKILTPSQSPDKAILEQLWRTQFHDEEDADLRQPLTYFLDTLADEVKAQHLLKPFVDTRALDQLYTIAERAEDQVAVQIEMRDMLHEIRDLIKQGDLAQEVTVSDVRTKASFPHPNLPARPYTELVGRDSEFHRLMGVLKRDQGGVISIVGMGGMGKTALAWELAEQYWESGQCDDLIWTSAKLEELVGGEIQPLAEAGDFFGGSVQPKAQLSLTELVDTLCQQLGRRDLIGVPDSERWDTIRRLLQARHYLVVIDNLETAENYRQLARHMERLLTTSWALITSRVAVPLETAFEFKLGPLSETASITLLQKEATHRNIQALQQANESELRQIAHSTGGLPLALKLVAGLLRRYALEQILANLQSVTGSTKELYRFIYWTAWNKLSREARLVLVAMRGFADVAPHKALQIVSTVDDDAKFTEAVAELLTLSLLDSSENPRLGRRYYTIHPITRNFIDSEIMQEW